MMPQRMTILFILSESLEIQGKAYAAGGVAEVEGETPTAIVIVVFDPVEAALTDDFEGNTGGKGGSGQAHGDTAESRDGTAGDGEILVFEAHFIVGVLFRSGSGDHRRAAQEADKAHSAAGGAADDELATGGVLLAGTDDGIVEDVGADSLDQFLVGKDHAGLIDEIGPVAMDSGGEILSANVLCETQESGCKAAEDG